MKKITIVVMVILAMFTLQACKSSNGTDEFAFIDDFSTVVVGDGFENNIQIELSFEQQAQLKKILQTDNWKPITDLPAIGFYSKFTLTNNKNDIIYFNEYNGDALILIKYAANQNESLTYTAPLDLLTDLETFEEKIAEENKL
ncbi:MAG: hypothetical protein PHG02_03630 [Oscillospiraceae bacterium]|nr:hypothetical protein [Oscillospiraceae bacterium]